MLAVFVRTLRVSSKPAIACSLHAVGGCKLHVLARDAGCDTLLGAASDLGDRQAALCCLRPRPGGRHGQQRAPGAPACKLQRLGRCSCCQLQRARSPVGHVVHRRRPLRTAARQNERAPDLTQTRTYLVPVPVCTKYSVISGCILHFAYTAFEPLSSSLTSKRWTLPTHPCMRTRLDSRHSRL